MFSSSLWMLLLAVVASLHSFAMAQLCDMPEGWERFGFTAYNQTELDIIARSCTIFNGNLYVDSNYTGGFYLPNVRHIVGDLGVFLSRVESDEDRPNLTSVELPDLESVKGRVSFTGMPSLKTISMPELHSVNGQLGADASEEVDLRSLEAVSEIDIGGTLSTLRLDALTKAERHLVISKECEDEPPTPPLDIAFPSLITAGGIELHGRFSHVAMPQLLNISMGYSLFHSLEIDACGGPSFDVSLPQLDKVSMEVDISGGIQDLSIPKLKTTPAAFQLNTTEQLDLILPFEEAQAINLFGNLTSIKFPNLDVASSIYVDVSVPFDCGALKKSVAPALGDKAAGYNRCTAPAGLGLSLGAKIGIGVGVGVGGLLLIAAGVWFFLRRKKQTKRLKSESDTHLRDMPPTYTQSGNEGHPPDYAATDAR